MTRIIRLNGLLGPVLINAEQVHFVTEKSKEWHKNAGAVIVFGSDRIGVKDDFETVARKLEMAR